MSVQPAPTAPKARALSSRMLRRPLDALHDPTLPSPLSLAPNDWILPAESHLQLLYFFDKPDSVPSEEFMDPSRMESALQRLLASYPLLDGHFVAAEKGTFAVEWAEGAAAKKGLGGVKFTRAEADGSLADLPLNSDRWSGPQCLPSSLQSGLVPQWDAANATGTQAMMHVQHTRFAGCGGVALSVHLHHMICDLEGLLQLMADWAELYETGGDKLQTPPTIDRSWLIPSEEEIALRLKDHVERTHFVGPDPYKYFPGCVARCEHFTPAQLQRLKEAATAPGVEWISTFEALTALLHRVLYRVRHGDTVQQSRDWAQGAEDRGEQAKLVMATNWRRRLRDPPCKPRLFANAAIYTSLQLPPTTLLDVSLPDLAARLHEQLKANDSDNLRAHMAWITAQEDRLQIRAHANLVDGMGITAWNKLGLYDLSFHGTNPTRITTPVWEGMQGVVVVMESPDGKGLDVTLGLEAESLARLEKDEEWRKFRA